jgi:O-succinylbenzoic acid--CoA ligase
MSLSIVQAAQEAPSQAALVTGSQTLSYAELAERSLQAVTWLRRRGLVGPEQSDSEPMAVLGTNELGTVELLHALWALGEPVLLVHPKLAPSERGELLRHVRARTLLDAAWRESSHTLEPAVGVGQVPDDERCLAVVATSATSGRARGVVLSRRAFVASARGSVKNLGWQADDRWLLCLPLAHIGGLSILTRCVLARRCAVLTASTDPYDLVECIERHRITLVSLVPALLGRLLGLRPSWQPPAHLRAVLLGGAAAPSPLVQQALAYGWPLLKTYGLTEACSQVTVQRYGGPGAAEPGVGHPLSGTELRIVDGRIQVRGPTLFSRYLPAPKHESALAEDGWFDTSDLGSLDAAGRLHVLGRSDELIITGGENVAPLEVDRVLESCPGVRAACTFGLDDPEWGQLVAAALVVDEGTVLSLDALRAHVACSLAVFKRPRAVALLPRLPVSAAGKVDRAATARAAELLLERL